MVGGLHVGQEGLLGEAQLHFRPEEDGVVQIGDGAFNGGGVSELPEILKKLSLLVNDDLGKQADVSIVYSLV